MKKMSGPGHWVYGMMACGVLSLVTGCWPPHWLPQDEDGDTFKQDTDCDDQDAAVYPGAEEIAYDGIDQDCDGADLTDLDGDHHDALQVPGGDDCADEDAEVYPGAAEVCDGKDNNCDGFKDDGDRDGVIGEACGGADCDDTNATVYPRADEIPYDDIDQNCDGVDIRDWDGDGEEGIEVGGPDCLDDNPDMTSKNLIVIQPGKFLMGTLTEDPTGDADEKPQHEVFLSAYCMMQYEVTNKQYRDCVDAGACISLADAAEPPSRPGYFTDEAYNDYPAVSVSWEMAHDYCAFWGGELPTEAQWEKAARGGLCLNGDTPAYGAACEPNPLPARVYPWGDDPATCSLANYNAGKDGEGQLVYCIDGVAARTTDSILSRPDGSSPYGLLNLSGNVAEWVRDCYDDVYYGTAPTADPIGGDCEVYDTRVLRGGGWNATSSKIRAAIRDDEISSYTSTQYGFRCGRDFIE